METPIEGCGRLALVESSEGFRWELTTRAGCRWHWNPLSMEWTRQDKWFRTQEEASAGLEAVLTNLEPVLTTTGRG
jgi:hypothetical protein